MTEKLAYPQETYSILYDLAHRHIHRLERLVALFTTLDAHYPSENVQFKFNTELSKQTELVIDLKEDTGDLDVEKHLGIYALTHNPSFLSRTVALEYYYHIRYSFAHRLEIRIIQMKKPSY